jgi:hypothetical protein
MTKHKGGNMKDRGFTNQRSEVQVSTLIMVFLLIAVATFFVSKDFRTFCLGLVGEKKEAASETGVKENQAKSETFEQKTERERQERIRLAESRGRELVGEYVGTDDTFGEGGAAHSLLLKPDNRYVWKDAAYNEGTGAWKVYDADTLTLAGEFGGPYRYPTYNVDDYDCKYSYANGILVLTFTPKAGGTRTLRFTFRKL